MKTTTMLLFTGVVPLCVSVQAQDYHLKADFSTTSNPNGVWKFGWSQGISGAFVLFPRQHIPRVNNNHEEMWDDPANSFGFTPSVARNSGGDFDDGNVTLMAGAIILHPCGVTGDAFAHVVWTAPRTGRYMVDSRFFAQQNGINVDVHVLTNGVSAFDATITENGVSLSFSQDFTLSTGDTIDFVVGPNDDFVLHPGNTGLDARITPFCSAASIRLSDVEQVEICWASVSNAVYQVDYRSELPGGTWLPLFTNVVGSGEVMCVSEKIVRGQPQRYYRVDCPAQ